MDVFVVEDCGMEYNGWFYQLDLQTDEDNEKRLHFAINVDDGTTVFLDYCPYTEMTEYVFKWFVDNYFPDRNDYKKISPISPSDIGKGVHVNYGVG